MLWYTRCLVLKAYSTYLCKYHLTRKTLKFDFRGFRRNSWRRFFRYTLPVIFLSLAFHLPSFIELKCQNVNSTTTKAEKTYNFWYKDIARLIFLGVLPFLILSVLNLKIFLAIRETRSQQNPVNGTKFAARNQGMELELEQAHRSTLIISVYFFFLLFYIAKKCFVIFVYKHNLDDDSTPIECMPSPSTVFRMTKASQSFVVDLISTINFFIFIYTGSKFREILLENYCAFIGFFKCSTQSKSSVDQIKLRALKNDQIQIITK